MHAHVRVRRAARTPIGNSGDVATAPSAAMSAPPAAISSAGYADDRDALAAGEPERAQRRLLDPGQRDLAGQHDPDRDQHRERRHAREDPQRDREHVDRVLLTP